MGGGEQQRPLWIPRASDINNKSGGGAGLAREE